jgi:predicted dehydrogenase
MRAVFVGVAHWHAPIYAGAMAKLGLQIAAASDLDSAAGAAAAAKLEIPFHADTASMLERVRPDFAFVLPRHDRALAELAPVLARQIPFLIEKPMGRNASEARAVAAAAAKSHAFAACALPNRQLAIWDRFRALERGGGLGTVMHAHFRIINGPPHRYREWGVPWMLDPAISGGGALRNLGFHGADATLSLAGERPVEVRGARVTRVGYGLAIEEFASAILEPVGGPLVTIEFGYSYAAAGGDFEWRIAATGAYLKQSGPKLEVRLADGSSETSEVAPPSYDLFVADMLTRLREGRPPGADLTACASAADLIDRIYQTTTVR